MKKIILIAIFCFFHLSATANPTKYTNIDLDELQSLLKKQPKTILLDIRDPSELKVTGTINYWKNYNISRGWLETRVATVIPDFDTPVVAYCGLNIRSPLAAETLISMGYTDVYNFEDGVFDWETAGNKMYYYDEYKESPLYSKPIKVIDDVYSAIGATQPGTSENYAHNNNLSYIIGDEGILVFNAGGSYILAKALHQEIKKVSSLPIKYVVYENTQYHATLGSTYWKEQGAKIIAHENATDVINEPDRTIERVKGFLGNKFFMSDILPADIYVSDKYVVPLKGKNIEILHLGPAHGHDELLLWMPDEKLVITGDFAFNTRMLPVLPTTDINAWLESWPRLIEMKPQHIIPGHGGPATIKEIEHFTKDYLLFLKTSIENLLDEDGEINDVYNIDDSKYSHFDLHNLLSTQNLTSVFKKFEFEY